MALTTASVALGGAALAAYLDARLHLRNDLGLQRRRSSKEEVMALLARKMSEDKMTTYHLLEDRAAAATATATFLWFEGRTWTYAQFFAALQPVGNWLMKELSIQRGEIVALDGQNSPEFMLLWFALQGIGASPAFINCNMTAGPLAHCVKISGSRYLIADHDVRHLVEPTEPDLQGCKAIYYSPAFIETLSDTEPLPQSRRTKVDRMGVASLIYTSGTTGMPKAVSVSRGALLHLASVGWHIPLLAGHSIYSCLPLYHSAAQGLAILPAIGNGATFVLSRKFSHRTFWPEVHASGATHIQYVGELCRYLVNAPPSPLDRGHKVSIAWGNGMRPDVWERFRTRFGVETIHELYAATDGMSLWSNPNRGEFTRNAIDLRGLLWRLQHGANEKLVRIDPDSQEIVRNPRTGFAIEAGTDEPGEAILRLDAANPDAGSPTYHGNHSAAVRRRVADVFRKGDLWFRSGDLLRLDRDGRLFFVDRLGDTFRWRSENVSTNEVSDVVGEFAPVAEANVYGVLVPNADGRAGCAAIVPREGGGRRESADDFDWRGLAEHCLARLPRYAMPIFVRVVQQLEYTGTMKMQKGRLRSEGIDLDVIQQAAREKGMPVDVMYWLPPGQRCYVPFTKQDLQAIRAEKVRL